MNVRALLNRIDGQREVVVSDLTSMRTDRKQRLDDLDTMYCKAWYRLMGLRCLGFSMMAAGAGACAWNQDWLLVTIIGLMAACAAVLSVKENRHVRRVYSRNREEVADLFDDHIQRLEELNAELIGMRGHVVHKTQPPVEVPYGAMSHPQSRSSV